MSRQKPFEQHRFPAIVILCVVRMYLRYPLSYQDTVDLLAERRVVVDPHFDGITHFDQKWRNNRIESDHAALKRLLGRRQSFRSLSTAKATPMAIETIRTIKHGHIANRPHGLRREIDFVRNLFPASA